jgi:hypothetical protein
MSTCTVYEIAPKSLMFEVNLIEESVFFFKFLTIKKSKLDISLQMHLFFFKAVLLKLILRKFLNDFERKA